MYVIGIEPQSNTVYVGSKEELFTKEINLSDFNWADEDFEALVKIRYNMKAVKAKINGGKITFEEPVSAVTKRSGMCFI